MKGEKIFFLIQFNLIKGDIMKYFYKLFKSLLLVILPITCYAADDIHVVFQTGGDVLVAREYKERFESKNNVKLSIEEIPGGNLYEKLVTEISLSSHHYSFMVTFPLPRWQSHSTCAFGYSRTKTPVPRPVSTQGVLGLPP